MSRFMYYYIESQLSGLVLDVEYSKTSPGTKVTPWEKNGSDAQLWIDDLDTGTIRNKLNNYCLDIKDGVLVINPYKHGISQQWKRQSDFIVSKLNSNTVLDIAENNKAARATVVSHGKHGEPNQKWKFELSGVQKTK